MNPKYIPAFPTLERGGNGLDLTHAGMDLRDYFAAKAMQSIVSHQDADDWPPKDIAASAYDIADAMLAAREGR